MTAADRRLSVILCTHNPRADYFSRTIEALRAQTCAREQWELLVVDNASAPPVASTLDLSWHPAARIVPEPELGLTAARLRGIGEAHTPLLVFVDDDNLLAPDYLARVCTLSAAWPQLGAWGCGHFTPEWEEPPRPELSDYLAYLAVQRADRDRWSNRPFDYGALPAGAGMCVRAPVARRYAAMVQSDARRKRLGRAGGNLSACEDFDLALTAIDLGLGTGVFPQLAITHLMPRNRVEEAYLLRLVEGHAFSTVLLHSWRDPHFSPARSGLLARVREYRLRRSLGPVARKIHDARRRGELRAWRELASRSA